jgi:hypothetical protein
VKRGRQLRVWAPHRAPFAPPAKLRPRQHSRPATSAHRWVETAQHCTCCAKTIRHINSPLHHSHFILSRGRSFFSVRTTRQGQYQEEARSSACRNCASGYAASKQGSPLCEACPPGTYSGTRASTCIQCLRGFFAAKNASEVFCSSSSCRAFTVLTSSIASPNKVCTPCGSGTASANLGSPSCELCPAGRAQSSSAQSSCSLCAPVRLLNLICERLRQR